MSARRNRLRTSYIKRMFHKDDDAVEDAFQAANNYWVSLHTADPGLDGDQDTNEATYGGYARISVAISANNWTISGDDQVYPTAAVQFAQCTSDVNQAITHYGIGLSQTGSGTLLWAFTLVVARTVVLDYQPNFPAGSLTTTVT